MENITRRRIVMGSLASIPLTLAGRSVLAAPNSNLKISHQFPGSSGSEGDFRDQICRRFAAELEKRSNGSLKGTVYAGSSLMKTNAQFSSMRKGALDMSLVPLSYAGGEVPETNIGLMPGVVVSYEQGMAWKKAEVGKALADILADKGVMLVSWIWQAGGVASRSKPIIDPEDAKGLKVRGGSREMDMVLKAAGAAVLSLPSNEIYAAMQTGALDAAKADDQAVASVYQKAGGKAYDMSEATVQKWQAIARDTAWKDFAAKNESCARILRLAEKTL